MRGLLTLVFSCFLLTLSAQKVDKFLFLGKEAEDAKDLYKAAEIYQEGTLLTTKNPELNFKYAEVLRSLNNYELAEKFYLLTIAADSTNEFSIALFYLATMQKNNGRYSDALNNWELLKRLNSSNPESEIYKKAEQEILVCSSILKGEVPHYSYKIWNLQNLNTQGAEFAASYYDSTAMVYSKLARSEIKKKKEPPYIELHTSLKEKGTWNEGTLLPPAINQTGFQNANGSFSSDHRFFVFTRCEGEEKCMIYISLYKNGVYSKAFPIKVNYPGSTSTQPSLTKTDEGYVLFWSSDRPGGKGGLDIWYATADNDLNIGEAKNVAAVNSYEDEITPFYYHPTGELFFSSTWFQNIGGMDIFKSDTRDLITFDAPENIGLPYNSSANDSYFVINNRGYKGLLTSNREGSISGFGKTCCNDIYEFEYPIHLIERQAKRTFKETEIVEPTVQIKLLYDELTRLLPLALYFHNDEPDPRSAKNYTLINYQDCYYNYYAVKSRYDDVNAAQSSEIYTSLVQKGYDKLQRYLDVTTQLMKLGAAIELDVRGYASPLAKTNYNINLTSRRIESFMNYLKVYGDGVLLPYAVARGNQPQVRVRKLPYGENKSAPGVSDDYHNQDLSVYSLAAAKERRIEIVATRLILPNGKTSESIAVDNKTADPVAKPIAEAKKSTKTKKVTTKNTANALPDSSQTKVTEAKGTEAIEPLLTENKTKVKEGNTTASKASETKTTETGKPVIKTEKSADTKTTGSKSTKGKHPAIPEEKVSTSKSGISYSVPASDEIFMKNIISIDLGKIKKGQLLVKKLKFRNSYGKNINFTKVINECSCTDIKLATKMLVPEEETEFTLLFETRGKIGIQEGIATILTKEVAGNIVVRFKVEVVP